VFALKALRFSAKIAQKAAQDDPDETGKETVLEIIGRFAAGESKIQIE
jgi:hypothetical protein